MVGQVAAFGHTLQRHGDVFFSRGVPDAAALEAVAHESPGSGKVLPGDPEVAVLLALYLSTNGSAPPMTILRDQRTGEVRAILRNPPTEAQAAGDAGDSVLEVLVSRGLPNAEARRR